MSLAFIIDVDSAAAQAGIKALEERCTPRALLGAIREDMVGEVRAHLGRLDAQRANKLGGARTHFYEHEGQTARHELGDTELRVSVGEVGLRQRFLGGTIRAQNSKYLTLPARSEAYGKRAREFNNLRFVPTGPDTGLLITTDDSAKGTRRVRNKSGQLRNKRSSVEQGLVMFFLRRSVTQAADPSVLPDHGRLTAVALQGMRDFLEAAA